MKLYTLYLPSFFKDFLKVGIIKKILILLTPLIALVTSMKLALFGLLFLVLIDLLTGMIKNLKNRNIPINPLKLCFWEGIESSKLRETWKKAYQYGIGILVTAALESMILGIVNIRLADKTFTITEIIVIIAAIVEVKSIFENIKLTFVLDLVKKLMPKWLGDIFDKIK